MIKTEILEKARKKYLPEQIPFLTELRKELAEKKPYVGLKIFHNIPLTLQAVIKVEPLILGGAEVTVSGISSIKPQKTAINILRDAGIRVQLNHKIEEDYDIYLDCCAELIHKRPPKLGTVELTQTGSKIYKENSESYPVISVDDCLLKHLETTSTGEGFVDGFKKITNEKIKDKKFVLFGFGKVGRGILKALLKETKNITIVEKNPNHLFISHDKVKFVYMDDIENVKKYLKKAFCVVTATGVEGLISEYFDKKDFGNAFLSNMGAFDEYGIKFKKEDVLFDKQALNFYADEPTSISYLDLIFYAHNISINTLMGKELSPGYHAFDNQLSFDLLKKWSLIHEKDFHEILTI